MKAKLILGAISALALTTTAAVAADPIMPAPVAPISPISALAHDWTGFYAGINAGYGFGEAYGTPGLSDVFDSVDGLVGGAQIGASAQFDMFVLGVEGDIQVSGMSQEVLGVEARLDYFGTVRARAGVAIDNFMPYVTGGFAYGGGTIDDGIDSDNNTHWGWTVGAGVEVAMDQSVSFKAEYLYTDLGAEEYFAPGGLDAGLRFHTVRAGVNFHF